MKASRDDVLRYRVHAQQLDRATDRQWADSDILDLGVQDTGNEGSAWALALRGVRFDPEKHLLAWSLRGVPAAYRRAEAAEVATAVSPYDEADAAKRVITAAGPLKAAGIPVFDALAVVAQAMREIVAEPRVKGDVSARLTGRLPDAYLRYCSPCGATHSYEMPFRLAALAAGLELQPGTSPPVLARIPGWTGPATDVPPRLDPVRACLHLFGPLTPKHVAQYIDAPVRSVTQRWPADVEEIDVDGERRWILTADAAALKDAPAHRGVRLLGSHDLFLQARDRELIMPDAARRTALWPTLGRPGVILHGHDLVGTWRPRSSGARLALAVETWATVPKHEVADQAARLAAHRGQTFTAFA